MITLRATTTEADNKARLLARLSLGTAEVLDSSADSRGWESSWVEVKRARRPRGLGVRVRHRAVSYQVWLTIAKPSSLTGPSVGEWPVHIHGVRCFVIGGGKTRVKLDCGLGILFDAREEERAPSGSGLGWFVDIQRLVQEGVRNWRWLANLLDQAGR